jgi:hypothetical protein
MTLVCFPWSWEKIEPLGEMLAAHVYARMVSITTRMGGGRAERESNSEGESAELKRCTL